MFGACNTAPSAAKASSLVQGSLKRGARRSLVPDASSRACSGGNPVPKTSWPCVVSTPAIDSTPFGKTGSIPTPPATTASHSQRNRRILSYAPAVKRRHMEFVFIYFSWLSTDLVQQFRPPLLDG